MVIREKALDRFSFAIVMILTGYGFAFRFGVSTSGLATGIPLLIVGIAALIKGVWFSPLTILDAAGIHHTDTHWFTHKPVLVSYDEITRFVEEDRISTEEGKCVKIEVASGDSIILPSGAISKALDVYRELNSKAGRTIPSVRVET